MEAVTMQSDRSEKSLPAPTIEDLPSVDDLTMLSKLPDGSSVVAEKSAGLGSVPEDMAVEEGMPTASGAAASEAGSELYTKTDVVSSSTHQKRKGEGAPTSGPVPKAPRSEGTARSETGSDVSSS